MLTRFWNDKNGATVVEYGIIIAVISLVIATGMGQLGSAMQDLLGNRVANKFK